MTKGHELDVDGEGFCLRSGRWARVGTPEWASNSEAVVRARRVLHGGRESRIWLGGDVAVGAEPVNCEKLSKTVVSPLLPLTLREDASSVSSQVVRKRVVYAVVFDGS